ncbi:MAG TPA: lytic transglycosylase domain-containing protein [Ferrovaceae bacterium]|nr:lytic transglycosylase domain-containing protein [Ferrovaceae bacterium]
MSLNQIYEAASKLPDPELIAILKGAPSQVPQDVARSILTQRNQMHNASAAMPQGLGAVQAPVMQGMRAGGILGFAGDEGSQIEPSPLDKALTMESVNPQVAALAQSIYQQESSGGRNTATSNAGAVGVMQMTPATFKQYADKDWNINNPVDNARAGVRYINDLYSKTGSPALTAIGYYGGPHAIKAAQEGRPISDPRNPHAPNTFEYARNVVGRMLGSVVPSAQAAENVPAGPDPATAERMALDMQPQNTMGPIGTDPETVGMSGIGMAKGGIARFAGNTNGSVVNGPYYEVPGTTTVAPAPTPALEAALRRFGDWWSSPSIPSSKNVASNSKTNTFNTPVNFRGDIPYDEVYPGTYAQAVAPSTGNLQSNILNMGDAGSIPANQLQTWADAVAKGNAPAPAAPASSPLATTTQGTDPTDPFNQFLSQYQDWLGQNQAARGQAMEQGKGIAALLAAGAISQPGQPGGLLSGLARGASAAAPAAAAVSNEQLKRDLAQGQGIMGMGNIVGNMQLRNALLGVRQEQLGVNRQHIADQTVNNYVKAEINGPNKTPLTIKALNGDQNAINQITQKYIAQVYPQYGIPVPSGVSNMPLAPIVNSLPPNFNALQINPNSQ